MSGPDLSSNSELHARFACPGWQYTTTAGPRKQWDGQDTPPDGDGWERNADAGRDGWERFDYTERSYWRRPVPERERMVHDDPVLAAQIREGIAEAEHGETVDLGDFAQYLEACREFRVACVALFWAVAEGLRLPQFLSWLSRRLGGDGA